jgi:hypothetical protein
MLSLLGSIIGDLGRRAAATLSASSASAPIDRRLR